MKKFYKLHFKFDLYKMCDLYYSKFLVSKIIKIWCGRKAKQLAELDHKINNAFKDRDKDSMCKYVRQVVELYRVPENNIPSIAGYKVMMKRLEIIGK